MKSMPRLVGSALVLLAACAASSSVRAQVLAATPVLDPANGHYYGVVFPNSYDPANPQRAYNYLQAKTDAATLTFNGMTGHLATVTSQDEQNFIVNNLSSLGPYGLLDFWLGGEQTDKSNEPAGGWSWITGEPWSYTNWHSGEPNNFGGNEDFLEMWLDNQWSDRAADNGVFGSIVEFEGTGPAPIPEPGTLSLLLTVGLPGLLAFRRRSR